MGVFVFTFFDCQAMKGTGYPTRRYRHAITQLYASHLGFHGRNRNAASWAVGPGSIMGHLGFGRRQRYNKWPTHLPQWGSSAASSRPAASATPAQLASALPH